MKSGSIHRSRSCNAILLPNKRRNFRLKSIFHFFLAILFCSFQGRASQLACWNLLDTQRVSSASLGLLAQYSALTPYERMLILEQTANRPEFVQPTGDIQISIAKVSQENVIVRTSEHLPVHVVETFFLPDGSVLVPFHPRNSSSDVPWSSVPRLPQTWSAQYTASRTMAVGRLGIKMGTDQPTPSESKPKKADLRNGVILSIDRSRVIERIDGLIGRDPRLIILKDVLSLADPASGNGIVVRDHSPLLDGSQWIPNHSLPYVGEELANLHGITFSQLIEKHYAAPLGAAKALLLIRYGLEMKFPHIQNHLSRYSQNLQRDPRGAIAFRDLSDTAFFQPIAELIAPTELQADIERRYDTHNNYLMNWKSSSFGILRALGGRGPSMSEQIAWGRAHDEAFIQTLENELGEIIPRIQTDLNFAIAAFFRSGVGRDAIKKYHRNRREHLPFIDLESILRVPADSLSN